jgi:hypothetical protein
MALLSSLPAAHGFASSPSLPALLSQLKLTAARSSSPTFCMRCSNSALRRSTWANSFSSSRPSRRAVARSTYFSPVALFVAGAAERLGAADDEATERGARSRAVICEVDAAGL